MGSQCESPWTPKSSCWRTEYWQTLAKATMMPWSWLRDIEVHGRDRSGGRLSGLVAQLFGRCRGIGTAAGLSNRAPRPGVEHELGCDCGHSPCLFAQVAGA